MVCYHGTSIAVVYGVLLSEMNPPYCVYYEVELIAAELIA